MESYIARINGIMDLLSSPLYYSIRSLPISYIYTLELNDTMELVALKTLGDTDYWWVLSLYNQIINPFNPGAQTRTINIPNKQELHLLLAKMELD